MFQNAPGYKRRTREQCLYFSTLEIPPWRQRQELTGGPNEHLIQTISFMRMDVCDCDGCHDLVNEERVRLGIPVQP